MPQPPSWPVSLARLAVRIALIAGGALVLFVALDWAMHALEPTDNSMPWAQLSLLLAVLLVYAFLLAIPFVPGVEIGITLLVLRGPDMAGPIYIATVTGLLAAYLIGRHIPYRMLHSVALDLHLLRICRLMDEIAPLSQARRLALLRQKLPAWMGDKPLKYRYILLAALVNLPGSALIGGGGGILLLAGLSHLFSPRSTALTLCLAVAPFPFLIWLFGTAFLQD